MDEQQQTMTTVDRDVAVPSPFIRTPDQRVRVFVSSTLQELTEERQVARDAIARLRLTPVLFELAARPHPPAPLYRAYLAQSDVFIGIYWQRYGWIAPGEEMSGLEDEYRRAGNRPKLIYVKTPAPEREPELTALLSRIEQDAIVSYTPFQTAEQLQELVENDLALVLTESFARSHATETGQEVRVQHPRDNLPVRRHTLVDRTNETATAKELLLRDDVGLVTLTGAGGTGKTRLALHLADSLRDTFTDGVVWVPLASLTDPALVPATIARALAIPEAPGQPLLESLQDSLRTKHMLILLDNVEHLLDAAPVVSQLLARCPRLTILATSRAPLHLYPEREIRVPPLALPKVDTLLEATALSQYAAVELFIQRARDVRPDFIVTNETAPAVAGICQRLDGLPLAIELAAARIKLFSPDALLVRLSQRLPLLTTGSRDLPERHQTLRSTIAWSYDLLDKSEARLLRRLSVFVGGFTLTAAQAVAEAERALPQRGDADVEDALLLEGVESLLDKSLLWVEEGTEGEPRFGMLETIREYTHGRLTESGEAGLIQRRHAAYFAGLAEQGVAHLGGPQQERWLRELDIEHENLRAALDWTQSQQGDQKLGLSLAGYLWRFWYIRGHLLEGTKWIETMLERTEEGVTLDRATALRGAGALVYRQRKHAAAQGYFERALAMCRELGDREGEAACLNNLAVVHEERGDVDTARALHEQSLVLRRAVNDRAGMAVTVGNLGALAHFTGDYARAQALYEEGLELEREVGNSSGMAITLANLGELMWQQDAWADAERYLREALMLGSRVGDRDVMVNCLEGFGRVAAHHGDPGRAVRLYSAAEAARQAMGSPSLPKPQAEREIHLQTLRATLGAGVFEQFWAEGQILTVDQGVVLALAPPKT